MRRERYFYTGLGILTILSICDLLITWILSPDLKHESNTFVTEYGFGWPEIISVNILFLFFVSIPFYYHSVIFNFPSNDSLKLPLFKYLITLLLKNAKKPFLSIAKLLFNFLGFYLFWWYFISKFSAVFHNLFLFIGSRYYRFEINTNNTLADAPGFSKNWFYKSIKQYCETPEGEQFSLMKNVENTFLLVMALIFLFSLVLISNNKIKIPQSKQRLKGIFTIIFFLLYITFRGYVFFASPPKNQNVNLSNREDPDIILINIEQGDRAFIGNLISKVDSCHPQVIGLDISFENEKKHYEDSVLENTLRKAKNIILSFYIDSLGKPIRSADKFRKSVKDEGLNKFEFDEGLVSKFSPLLNVNNQTYEQFPLKIIKLWKPQFQYNFKENASIPIIYTRTRDQYFHLNGSELEKQKNCLNIKDKIVLIGYLGPSNEDKYFTPMGNVQSPNSEQPDTYGIVIIANQIRTILDYKKRK